MNNLANKNAIVYCRVSSRKQVEQGNGISSQDSRCIHHAKSLGLNYIQTFKDEAVSGNIGDRKGFNEMLAFLDRRPRGSIVVLVDDISRIARDVMLYHRLMLELKKRDTVCLFLNQNNDHSPEGKLSENMLASMAQYGRDDNTRRVISRQTSRLKEGFWPFRVPYGYNQQDRKTKIPSINEESRQTIIELFEGYASGRFQTLAEAKTFAETRLVVKSKNGLLHKDFARDVLINPFYAGYIHYPKWQVSMVLGKHEALIKPDLFFKVQDRLSSKAKPKVPFRKDADSEFPLRGFVKCGCCNSPLTASFSKGRTGYHAYYRCKTKPTICELGGKSISKSLLEDEFRNILSNAKPDSSILKLSTLILQNELKDKTKTISSELGALKSHYNSLEIDQSKLISLILSTDDKSLKTVYEGQLKLLLTKIEEVKLSLATADKIDTSFGTAWKNLLSFLENPVQLWDSKNLESKRTILKMIFAEKLTYIKNKGFGTAQKTLPFKLLLDFKGNKRDMVEPRGIEPLTSTLPASRSPS